MQTLSNDKILELLANLVGTYLADNGGDQYDTFVRGTIVPNKLGGIISIHTPGISGKSRNYIKSLGDGLEKEIKKLLHFYEFNSSVVLDAEYQGEGVYIQTVSVLQTKLVNIPQRPQQVTPLIIDEEVEKEKERKKKQNIEAENKRRQDKENRLRKQRQSDDESAMLASVSAIIACI